MKKTILFLLITAFTVNASAQGKKSITGVGTGIAEITWVNGKPALNLGGYGGVLINHQLLIGAAGNNIFFKHTVNNQKTSFQFNYYGLYTEYRLMPGKAVGASVALTGGLGWMENNYRDLVKTGRKDGNFTYVIQPKVGVNVKITSFMQVQGYTSYRFTGHTQSTYYQPRNYNGFSAGVGLSFGSF